MPLVSTPWTPPQVRQRVNVLVGALATTLLSLVALLAIANTAQAAVFGVTV